MNYLNIINGLAGFDKSEVSVFVNYLKQLETEKTREGGLKNAWIKYFKEDQAIDLYKKVAIDNLFIDGETITLQFKGKVMVSYNYQAYKNRLLNIYPESKFDLQLVNEGDDFSFRKESGKVVYTHKINNPFADELNIIGTYCIIKNSRGEFLETLNMKEINKMKQSAKTQNIWRDWFGEMVLKSVIKRACKRHFRDITSNIDQIDNENFDPSNVGFPDDLREQIEYCKTIEQLTNVYEANKDNVEDKVQFVALLGDQKSYILDNLPEISKEDYEEAVELLKSGKSRKDLGLIWKIDEDTMQNLLSMAL